MTPDPAFLALLQFADGLFPAGGFAHSFGLETYAQEGRVRERAGLEAFVRAHLEGGAGPCDAVAVAHAARRAAAGEVPALVLVDERLDAMKCVPEFRAASRQMGRQTLRVAAGLGDDPIVGELRHLVEEGRAPGHHAVALGTALGRAGADAERAAAAYLYSTAAISPACATRRSIRGCSGHDEAGRSPDGAKRNPGPSHVRINRSRIALRSIRATIAQAHRKECITWQHLTARFGSASAAPSAPARPRSPRRSAATSASVSTWR